MSPRDGSARLVELEHRPLTKPLTTLVGYTLASGAAARFLGGGLAEILAAAAIGLVIGALAVLAERGARIGLLFEPISAFVCATIVSLAGVRVGGFSVPIATLAGLIVLMPGLTVTTAISELARQHLTAGTTRMAGAFMTFIGIAVGVALGYRIGGLAGTPVTVTPVPLAGWTAWVALIPASVAFAMLLKAERRDWPWIIGAGFVAVLASRAGTAMLGADLGVFVGAFVVGIYATLYQRHFLRPTPVTLVPGLMILVPGSVGFRGILALLDAQVISGINAGFNMLFTAAALVAGLLGAAAILRERGLSGEPTG